VGAIEEDNEPYRRLTIQWYKDLDTGAFLVKVTVEGEGVREGKREAVFALSSDEIVDVDLLNPSKFAEFVKKLILESNSLNDLVSHIDDLIWSIQEGSKRINVIDYLINFFIQAMAEAIARGAMVLDVNKLKMALNEEKS